MKTIHSKLVLVLNKQWQAISIISAAEAFSQIVSGTADPLVMEGGEILEPVSWDIWAKLPLEDGELGTGLPNRSIRTPKIIVLKTYAQMPMYRPKFSLKNIYIRDKGVCQYSGKKILPSQASIDHVIPQSKGGSTSWENCVLAERRLNSIKGDKSLKEAGLKLMRRPFEPEAIPVVLTLKNSNNIPEWDYFLVCEVA